MLTILKSENKSKALFKTSIKISKLQQKKSSPNQSTKELSSTTLKESNSCLPKLKSSTDNQSIKNQLFNKEQEHNQSLDLVKKSTIKLIFNLSFKERMFK